MQELDFSPYDKDPAIRAYLEGQRFISEEISFVSNAKSLSQQEIDAFIQEVIKEVKEKLK